MVYGVRAIPSIRSRYFCKRCYLTTINPSLRWRNQPRLWAVLAHLKTIGQLGGIFGAIQSVCDSHNFWQTGFNEINKLSAALHFSSGCKQHATGCEWAIVAQVAPVASLLDCLCRGCAQFIVLLFCASPRHCRFTMVRCHLSTLMGRDKLRISDVSRLTGLNRSTVTSLYKETVTRVDVAAIDALCNLFRCSVGELFEHVPDADGSLA